MNGSLNEGISIFERYSLSDKPELRAFDPVKTVEQKYPVSSYQPIYYISESFEDAKEKVRLGCLNA